MSVEAEQWDMVIEARRGWWDLRLPELWRARELIMMFVWRDFVSYYKQTILGPLWYLIQPVLTTITFTIIFGRIAQLSTDGLPQFLFYLSGTVIWNYFSACVTGTANTFIANAGLFGKVYFPRMAVPVSILASKLISFAIQFVMFLGFTLYFWLAGSQVHLTSWALLTPVLLVLMAGLGLGVGIIVSSLTTRYRDLQQLVSFGVSLLMYATPVIYPVSAIPEAYRPLIMANPLTPVVEAFRAAFLGTGSVSLGGLWYSAGFMVVTLIFGLLIFNRVEQTFMDTV